jgi:hypothetical protein
LALDASILPSRGFGSHNPARMTLIVLHIFSQQAPLTKQSENISALASHIENARERKFIRLASDCRGGFDPDSIHGLRTWAWPFSVSNSSDAVASVIPFVSLGYT